MTQFDPRRINHLDESYFELEGALIFYRIAQEKARAGVVSRGDVDFARAQVRVAVANVRKEQLARIEWGPRTWARLDLMLGDKAEAARVKRRFARLG